MPREGKCSVDNCVKAAKERGLCAKHLAKQELEEHRAKLASARIEATVGRGDGDADLHDDSDLGDEKAPAAKNCTRPGCGRKLRSDNTKGTCGSSCLSSEAPAFQRAKGVDGKPPIVRSKPNGKTNEGFNLPQSPRAKKHPFEQMSEVLRPLMPAPKLTPAQKTLEKFRQLAEPLGIDPDELLAQHAQTFIDRVKAAFNGDESEFASDAPVSIAAGTTPPLRAGGTPLANGGGAGSAGDHESLNELDGRAQP